MTFTFFMTGGATVRLPSPLAVGLQDGGVVIIETDGRQKALLATKGRVTSVTCLDDHTLAVLAGDMLLFNQTAMKTGGLPYDILKVGGYGTAVVNLGGGRIAVSDGPASDEYQCTPVIYVFDTAEISAGHDAPVGRLNGCQYSVFDLLTLPSGHVAALMYDGILILAPGDGNFAPSTILPNSGGELLAHLPNGGLVSTADGLQDGYDDSCVYFACMRLFDASAVSKGGKPYGTLYIDAGDPEDTKEITAMLLLKDGSLAVAVQDYNQPPDPPELLVYAADVVRNPASPACNMGAGFCPYKDLNVQGKVTALEHLDNGGLLAATKHGVLYFFNATTLTSGGEAYAQLQVSDAPITSLTWIATGTCFDNVLMDMLEKSKVQSMYTGAFTLISCLVSIAAVAGLMAVKSMIRMHEFKRMPLLG